MSLPTADPLLSPSVFRDVRNYQGRQQLKAPNIQLPSQLGNLMSSKADMRTSTKQRLTIGQRIGELFYSRFAYEPDDENESYWQFEDLLGYGSYGIAAVYRKVDGHGNIIKKMVVKAEQGRSDLNVNPRRPDISKEAFHHAQINKRNNYSNAFLHGFRYHKSDRLVLHPQFNYSANPFEEWRYYLEFCHRGTLHDIWMKYRVWGYHLPESFIWWVFYHLVRSCRSMESNNEVPFLFHGPAAFLGRNPHKFMLHNDLSWGNILFQHENLNLRRRAHWDRYPCPKVADFGLSQIRGEYGLDRTNSAKETNHGTPYFAPPEKWSMELETDFYPFEPHNHPDAKYNPEWTFRGGMWKDTHAILPSTNIWGAAYLVYMLMTLADPDQYYDHMKEILQGNFWKAQLRMNSGMDYRRLSMGLYLFDDIYTQLPTEESKYSDQLLTLVHDCLRIQPYKRPKLEDIEKTIQEGMKREADRLYEVFEGDQEAILAMTRVPFDNDEWNKIPKGPYNFGADLSPGVFPQEHLAEFWNDFHDHFVRNKRSDEAFLVPPEPNMRYLRPWEHNYQGERTMTHHVANDHVMWIREQWRPQLHSGEPLHFGGRACPQDSPHTPADSSDGGMDISL